MIPYLGVLIKLWANAEGVCGAQHGHLSSYSLTLMVLYYMQVDIYVKMPCFPTWEFTGQKRLPDCANVHWQCPLQLHALVSRFFEFYATSHCWGYEVVSPRVGERFYANDSCFASLSGRDNTSMLHIEDPFLLTRNLNCVLGPTQQDLLYRKFCEAHADLESGKIPRGFIMALETHKAKNIERPIQLENGAVEQTSSTNRDEKPAMQKGSQERTQNGARANAMSEAVEIRRDGRRDVTAKQSAAPQRKQKISNKSIAPTPEDMPSTDLFNQPFSAAPTIDDRPKTLEEYIKDTEIADGTIWSL
jgi:DNA polymerase sigma